MTARHKPRRSSPLYLPSAFDLFKPSRDIILKNLNVFGWLYALPLIIWVHSWISIPAHGGHYLDRTTDANFGWSFPSSYLGGFIGFSLFWFVISFAAGTAIQIMPQQAQLDASTHKVPDLARSWATVNEIGWRMLGLYIVMGLLIGIGFILLIIPGLFALRRYLLAPYVMLDKKCGIKEALDKSAELSLINPGSVWG